MIDICPYLIELIQANWVNFKAESTIKGHKPWPVGS